MFVMRVEKIFRVSCIVLVLFFMVGSPFALAQSSKDCSTKIDLLEEDPFGDGEIGVVGGIYDPLEPVNRVVFEFNDRLYYWLLKPVNNLYSALVPEDIRSSVGKMFENLKAPVRFINKILQGEFKQSGVVASRFFINSTIGAFGLTDPAYSEFGLEPLRGDFGQTLGKYGLGEGVYICWPVLGPSNLRDSVGMAMDGFLHPVTYAGEEVWVGGSVKVVGQINYLSLYPETYEDIKKFSLDPYVALRQGYTEYRKGMIFCGTDVGDVGLGLEVWSEEDEHEKTQWGNK